MAVPALAAEIDGLAQIGMLLQGAGECQHLHVVVRTTKQAGQFGEHRFVDQRGWR